MKNPAAKARGNNPCGITNEVVGDGYRLLTRAEIDHIRSRGSLEASYDLHALDYTYDNDGHVVFKWFKVGIGHSPFTSYRTRKPKDYFLTNYPI